MPAYNNYFPVGYQPYVYQQQPQQPMQQVPQNNNGIIWVQGEAGAKSYLVGAGQSVLLMDSESESFYIKTTDASGMPQPLRVFDYKERTGVVVPRETIQAEVEDKKEYATKDEVDEMRDEIEFLKTRLSRRKVKDEEDG